MGADEDDGVIEGGFVGFACECAKVAALCFRHRFVACDPVFGVFYRIAGIVRGGVGGGGVAPGGVGGGWRDARLRVARGRTVCLRVARRGAARGRLAIIGRAILLVPGLRLVLLCAHGC